MPYTPTTWQDETPASTPIKYKITDDSSGVLGNSAKIELVTSVTPGTPINATNLNKMENGIQTAQSTAETGVTNAAAAQATANAAVPKSLSTAIGQILYSTASGIWASLVKPSVRSFLQNTNAGALSWEALFGIHAKAIKTYDAGVQSIVAATYQDVTNASQNIVTTKTCTIVMIATGCWGCDNAAFSGYARPVINGNAPATDAGSAQLQSSTGFYPFTVLHYVTGVPAGTITCKIQGKLSATGSVHLYFSAGTIMLFAIEE